MGKLALTASVAAIALVAAASLSPAKAADSDFKGYTQTKPSQTHKYTPDHSKSSNSSSNFKGYTSMPPSGSQAAEAPSPNAQSPNPTAVTPPPNNPPPKM